MNINETFRYLDVGLPQDILRHKMRGNLDEAVRLIDLRLQKDNVPEPLRKCMIVQREMMLRIPENFPHHRRDAVAHARTMIPDFTEEELEQLLDDNRINWTFINGEMYLFDRFVETLIKTDPEMARRSGEQRPLADERGRLDRCMDIMKEKGSLGLRLRVRAALRMNDDVFKPGTFVRAHLPIPAACPQQSEIVIEKVDPPTAVIAPESDPARTVCWEETMTENHAFVVEYSYVHRAAWHDVSKCASSAEQPSFDTQEEAPHIVFTPYIRALVETLTEGVTDPLEKARRFYDFITKNMNYTYMPEYFVLEGIAENCARNGIGDCGVFALLFITLCRCAGIPARWQSGMCVEPDGCGSHDWAMFYVEPYGWLWADPSFGVSACHAGKEERRQFYFTSQDPYRMVANSAFQAPFMVEKQHWRADPYDSQSGEMETAEKGLDYDEYEQIRETLLCEEIAD